MSDDFKGRREDLRLVTGRGRYTADWSLPGQVHAFFLRSDRAHAAITRLDVSAARAMPGVLAILSGADVVRAGIKTARPLMFMKGKDGTTLRVPERSPLAHERVRFVGEPVALVVAESEAAAQDAAERIVVDYCDLPVVVGATEAAAPAAPQLHAGITGNLALDYEYGNRAATDAAFAGAHQVVRVSLDAQRIAGNPMEPKSCLAAYDAATDSFDLYVPTQGISDIRKELAYMIDKPIERIRIHSQDVGGAFGVRNEVYPEFTAVLHAAQSIGRPVKWTGTRAETILGDHHARAARLTGELALDQDGSFLAMRVEWLVNVGAYCSNAGPFINTGAAPTSMAVNAYRTPALHGMNKLVFTNTTPTTAYRGAGRPNVAYLVERLVEEAARVTGIDRVKLRQRNLLPRKAFPYKTPTGFTYDSGDPPGLLKEALEAADWKGFERRRREAKRRGKLRGIGCAVFIEPSGGAGQEEIAIRFDGEGKLDLFALAGPSGQGHETVFPDIVAGILGVAPEQIRLRYNDSSAPPLVGTGSFGSRSMISHGGALSIGAHEIKRKGMELAAKDLEVAASDLVFDNGRYRVPGTDLSVDVQELARKHSGALDTVAKLDTAAAFPSGAHVAEIEIDPATGTLELVRYTAVDDCGNVLNHTMVEGQLHGGLMQGIGQILGEHCIYDTDTGQLLTGTFMDYYMPRADAEPELALHHRPIPSPSNPLGVKGAGEAGTTGAIPTITNAVMDALAPLGVAVPDTPYSPFRIWSALQSKI
ncbi:MAG: xanthine dehydrogenase family protein molybdopterin-binding subunit [Hyphomicrobiales bacterium]|nr:xanthine dehydrogenase family protein molybdopterin-binding subunit [Hyphomicrobiales bacterium]